MGLSQQKYTYMYDFRRFPMEGREEVNESGGSWWDEFMSSRGTLGLASAGGATYSGFYGQ